MESDNARPIAAIPLAHLLLLPRSLLILSSSLYTSHLHGISALTEDDIYTTETGSPRSEGGVVIANADLLGDSTIVDSLRQKGRWKGQRGTRTSLTFRHANKVLKGGAFSVGAGRLKRT